jgi:hypothetical protein
MDLTQCMRNLQFGSRPNPETPELLESLGGAFRSAASSFQSNGSKI